MRCPTKEVWNGDYKCINIDCDKNIPPHIVEKQFTHPKSRVCVRCRNFKDIKWKCIGCDNIIDNNIKKLGVFYCSIMCRTKNNFERHNPKKIKVIKPTIIKNCIYCEKILIKPNAMKFCDTICYRKNRLLEVHKKRYKKDMINRANARHKVKHPNADIEKREKHKDYQQFYHKRWYNIKKLVKCMRDTTKTSI